MANLSLGVSLIFSPGNFDEPMYRAMAAAGVVTFEINAAKLAQESQRRACRQLLSMPGPRPSSVHALFGPEYDFSQVDQAGWQQAVNRAIETVELAAALDIPIIVMHASYEPIEAEERPQRLEQVIEGFTRIGEIARSNGRRIAIEYLPRSCLGNSLDELNLLVDRLGEKTFGVCLDVNHLMGQYARLPEIVRALGDRLIATHISDCDEEDEKHWLPGKGVLDWPGFMQALRAIHYPGPFTYECEVEGDTLPEKLEALRANFNWLQNL
jgi:sugar phosphate isomerase/epimerase